MRRRSSCLTLALLLVVGSARAQETREHELPNLEEEIDALDDVKVRLTLANRFVGNADFGTFEATSNQPEGRATRWGRCMLCSE